MRNTIITALILFVLAARPIAQDDHRAAVEKWRADRETSLKAKDGWLSVAGLFFLREGRNTFGSDPANNIVLPPSAPKHAGWFDLANGKVMAHVNDGVAATFKKEPVREIELKKTTDLAIDNSLDIGTLSLFIHMSGDRIAIRMRDSESAALKAFRGLQWYPIDPAYRLTARLSLYAEPKALEVPNIIGDVERHTAPGLLAFTVNGQDYTVEPYLVKNQNGDRLWIVFRDATSGKETYDAARFVYADMPKPGETTTVLDFNRAYNPPCAFNPFTTCPLPTAQNRLKVRIEAGEKYTGHKSSSQ